MHPELRFTDTAIRRVHDDRVLAGDGQCGGERAARGGYAADAHRRRVWPEQPRRATLMRQRGGDHLDRHLLPGRAGEGKSGHRAGLGEGRGDSRAVNRHGGVLIRDGNSTHPVLPPVPYPAGFTATAYCPVLGSTMPSMKPVPTADDAAQRDSAAIGAKE